MSDRFHNSICIARDLHVLNVLVAPSCGVRPRQSRAAVRRTRNSPTLRLALFYRGSQRM
jgi:hypothetical protein